MEEIIKVKDIKKKTDVIKRYNQICKLNNLSVNTTEMVRISKELKKELDNSKVAIRETYDEVIKRRIKNVN